MMNKQANILQRSLQVGQSAQPPPLPAALPLPALETYSSLFPDQEVPCDIFPETDQLLRATPFYNSLSQGRSGGEVTDLQVDALLRETLEEIEEKQQAFSHLMLPDIKQEIKTEPDTDSEYFPSGLGQAPHIRGPEMSWTIEERNIIDRLMIEQTTTCKNCCPVR